jgi:exosortase
MSPLRVKRGSPATWTALGAGLVGLVCFQVFGNATRGYIDTASLFTWWFRQWGIPQAELGHAWFVVPAALLLFAWNLRRFPARPEAEPLGWLPWLAGSSLLHVLGFLVQQPRLSLLGLLLFPYALLRLSGRRGWAAAAVFPLAFLLLAMPLDFLGVLAFRLRQGVSVAALWLSQLCGWEVQRSGTQLLSAKGLYHYEIAAACSGLRSLAALAALCLLIGYLHLGRLRSRLALFLLSIPYAFLGNLLRVWLIIAASELLGPTAGGRMHAWGGWLVYGLVLGLAWTSLPWLRRVFGDKGPVVFQERVAVDADPVPTLRGRSSSLACGLVGATMLCLAWLGSRVSPMQAGLALDEAGLNPRDLPAFPGADWAGRRLQPGDFERQTLPADTGYARRLYLPSGDQGRAVLVSLVLSGRDRSSLHRPDLCLTGQGWSIVAKSRYLFGKGGRQLPCTLLEVEHAAIGGGKVQRGLVAYWYVGPQGVEPDNFERLLKDIQGRLAGRSDRWAYVLMQTEMPTGKDEALARMASLLEGLGESVGLSGGGWPAL